MKILITGAKGILGSTLVKKLSSKHQVFSFDIEEMDITDFKKVLDIITSAKPEITIHCAAFTNVDGCETDPEKAFLVNALGTQNVAAACSQNNSSLVYLSTDYVFDGTKKEPYLELDNTNPINIYGRSKLYGEWYVSHLLNKFFIIRTSWLFGAGGKNFVDTIINLAETQDELKVICDQIGSPTYAVDLAVGISELIKTNYYGIYHITNQGFCSWFEFAKKILEIAGLNKKVSSVLTKDYKRPAPRPHFSVLKNHLWKLKGFQLPRRFDEALRDYLG